MTSPKEDKIGPTGKFPNGKINEHDEGELAFKISSDKNKELIVIEFGKPVAWFALSARDTQGLVDILQSHIDRMEDKPTFEDAD